MKRSVEFSIVCLLTLSLSGCGVFTRSEKPYTEAKESKSLKLPKENESNSIVDYYQLPKLDKKGQQQPLGEQLNKNAPATVIPLGDDVRTVYDSKLATAWIEQSMEDVRQDLLGYFKTLDLNLDVKGQNPKRIEFQTPWYAQEFDRRLDPVLVDEDVEDVRYRYSILMEASDRRKEVKLTVDIAEQAYKNNDGEWQSSANLKTYRDFELLNKFLSERHDLAVNNRQDSEFYQQSMRLTMTSDDKQQPYFLVNAPYRRTWLKLSQVIDDLGFELEDKDPSDGLVIASFDYDDQFGMFDWLFGKSKNIIELPSGTYRFQVKSRERQAAIYITDANSKPLSADLVTKLQPHFTAGFGDKR